MAGPRRIRSRTAELVWGCHSACRGTSSGSARSITVTAPSTAGPGVAHAARPGDCGNLGRTALHPCIEDIAPLVAFLLDGGHWITGQTIFVNGGYPTR